MRHGFVVRAILAQLAGIQLLLGLYALFIPVSFYEDFPLGLNWVEVLPAYNEHLVRDVGGLFLGTGVLLGAAAWFMERRLAMVALVSFMCFSVPHTIWHLFNLEPYTTANAVGNSIALIATVVLPAYALLQLFHDRRVA